MLDSSAHFNIWFAQTENKPYRPLKVSKGKGKAKKYTSVFIEDILSLNVRVGG